MLERFRICWRQCLQREGWSSTVAKGKRGRRESKRGPLSSEVYVFTEGVIQRYEDHTGYVFGV